MLEPRSYKVACRVRGEQEWAYNALRFPSEDLAQEYAKDLYSRWTMLEEWRIEASDEPVMYYDKYHQRITEAPEAKENPPSEGQTP
jgi:hypothetical protein